MIRSHSNLLISMDMSQLGKAKEGRLKYHTKAIRENQISVAIMMLYLKGYEVELHYTGTVNASAAQECLEELEQEDQINIWSCSTKGGGIWTTEQRRWLKTGVVGEKDFKSL